MLGKGTGPPTPHAVAQNSFSPASCPYLMSLTNAWQEGAGKIEVERQAEKRHEGKESERRPCEGQEK